MFKAKMREFGLKTRLLSLYFAVELHNMKLGNTFVSEHKENI